MPSEAPMQGIRILLVEDNPVNQRLAIRLLEKQQHQVTLAENGLVAVQKFEAETFDVILMDMQMPIMDGLTATQRIRAFETYLGGHIPIIAMTANAMQGDRELCIEAGMDDYLSKPINASFLFEKLAQYGHREAPQP